MSCTECKGVVRLMPLDTYACQHFKLKPDDRGHFTWKGTRWRGLPLPLRIWFLFRILVRGFDINVAESLDKFGGCGCIDRLKSFTERLDHGDPIL